LQTKCRPPPSKYAVYERHLISTMSPIVDDSSETL
jgi:hypothetical protein